MSKLIYLKNVSTLMYDSSKCTGCGTCAIVCPHRVLHMQNKLVNIATIDKCMECGACMTNCRERAITVNQGVGSAVAVINGSFKKSSPTYGCNVSCE